MPAQTNVRLLLMVTTASPLALQDVGVITVGLAPIFFLPFDRLGAGALVFLEFRLASFEWKPLFDFVKFGRRSDCFRELDDLFFGRTSFLFRMHYSKYCGHQHQLYASSQHQFL